MLHSLIAPNHNTCKKETNVRSPTRARPESISRLPTIEVTKAMMLVQPLNPTLLDDVTMKTTSTILVWQSDSALWQTYSTASTSRLHRVNTNPDLFSQTFFIACIVLQSKKEEKHTAHNYTYLTI